MSVQERKGDDRSWESLPHLLRLLSKGRTEELAGADRPSVRLSIPCPAIVTQLPVEDWQTWHRVQAPPPPKMSPLSTGLQKSPSFTMISGRA